MKAFPVLPNSLIWTELVCPLRSPKPWLLAPMLFTSSIWKTYQRKYSLIQKCLLLTNVFNPVILVSLSHLPMFPWAQACLFQFEHLVNPVKSRLKSFEELRASKNSLYDYSILIYSLNITSAPYGLHWHWIGLLSLKWSVLRVPSNFINFSILYKLLHAASPIPGDSHHYMWKWETILQHPITTPQWDNIWEMAPKSSQSVVYKGEYLKIVMFCYWTMRCFGLLNHIRNLLEQ